MDFALTWLLENLPGSAALVISLGLAIAFAVGQLRQARAQEITADSEYLEQLGSSASAVVSSAAEQVRLVSARVMALEEEVYRLKQLVENLRNENTDLRRENAELKERIRTVEKDVNGGFYPTRS
jgi:predicted RNase H-like nuclease (RuvC/YqgF family)